MSGSEGVDLKSVVKAGAEAVSEVAKAGQEQQKTFQLGLDLVRRAGTFLGGVFGPASQELGHLFSDQMKFWRFKNAVSILEKAQAITDKRSLKPEQIKALGFGEGLLLLEAASLEEDESVQDMWARLMSNAVDPNYATQPEKMYIDILKSLSGREAILLDLLATIDKEYHKPMMTVAGAIPVRARLNDLADSKWRKFPVDQRIASVQNLVRLRCVTPRTTPIDVGRLFARMPDERRGSMGTNWAVVDPQKFETVLKTLARQQLIASGVIDYNVEGPRLERSVSLPEDAFALTALGRALLQACEAHEPDEQT